MPQIWQRTYERPSTVNRAQFTVLSSTGLTHFKPATHGVYFIELQAFYFSGWCPLWIVIELFSWRKETTILVGIDDAYGLQEGVDHRRAGEAHAAFAEVFGDLVGERGCRLVVLYDYLAIREAPNIFVEGAEFGLDGHKHFGIGYRRTDFQAIAYDSGILGKFFQLFVGVESYLMVVKIIERHSERLTLVENTFPREASLERLEEEHLEEAVVGVEGDTPLVIMIGYIYGVLKIAPMATAKFGIHFDCFLDFDSLKLDLRRIGMSLRT